MDDRNAELINRLLGIERRLEEMDKRLRLVEPASTPIEPEVPLPSPKPQAFQPPIISPQTDPRPIEPEVRNPSPEPPPFPPPIIRPQFDPTPQAPQVPQAPHQRERPSYSEVWGARQQSGYLPTGELNPPKLPSKPATSKSQTNDDIEYKIGRIGLLWAGAVVVVIGILYLVALAAAHTTATPQMRFAGEQALCFAFIAIGFFKRNEREEFGQLLTGIGSCGLYLSFAGGHVYKHLYSSEIAVALFAVLSLANLGYAAWRSSRSFLAIGMIGGLVSAMLPMHDYNAPLDVGLHFLILIPCALIIMRNKFFDMAFWLWIASTAALIPIYTYSNHLWFLRVAALYLDALICATAYGYVWKETPNDRICAIGFTQIAFAGIGGVAIEGVKNGSLHVLLLAAAATGVAWYLRERQTSRNSLYAAAVTIAVTLAPMGYTRTEAAITFAVLSIALSIGATKIAPNLMRILAYAEIALATCAYLGVWLASPPPLPYWSEVSVLVAMMAAVVTGAVCAARTGVSNEGALAVGVAAMLPLFERFGNLFLTNSSVGASPNVSAFFTTIVGFSILFAFARTTKLVASVVACWVMYVIAVGLYALYVLTNGAGLAVELSMLSCLVAAAVLLVPITALRTQKDDKELVIGISGLMVGVYVVRLSNLLFAHYTNFSVMASVVVGATVWTAAALLVHRRLKVESLLQVSWVGLGVSLYSLAGMATTVEKGAQHQPSLLLVTLACCLAVGLPTSRIAPANMKQFAIGAFGALMTLCWSRLLYIELTTRLNFANSQAVACGVISCLPVYYYVFHRYKHEAAVILTWAGSAAFLGLILPNQADLGIDHGGRRDMLEMLTLGLAAPLLCAYMTAKVTTERQFLTAVTVALSWISFTRVLLHIARNWITTGNPVVSLTWTAFAAILISIGFGYRAQYLRYSALIVFATVLAKVFLLDLENVESAVRVAILLFLGLCMVASGYGYVRWKQIKPQPNV